MAAIRRRHLLSLAIVLGALPLAGRAGIVDSGAAPPITAERLGNVAFSVSCSARVRVPFNRGVALLHDFWYEKAQAQFVGIAKGGPGCPMAHWGIAMSLFHQIWD